MKNLSIDFCNLIKFLSCVLIYIGHCYCINYQNIVGDFGYIGCIIFFFLSGYGIVKSQMQNKLSFIHFFKKKFIKILIPLYLINLVVLFYATCRGDELSILEFHFSDPFLSFEKATFVESLLCLFDLHRMDPVTWFLQELFVGYLIIWILMKLKTENHRILLIIVIFFLFELLAYMYNLPKMFKIDTIGICGGFIYAHKECYMNTFSYKKFMIIMFGIILFAKILFLLIENHLSECFFILDFLTIFFCFGICMVIMRVGYRFFKKKHGVFSIFGGVSYFVYLIHMKFLCVFKFQHIIICFGAVLTVSFVLYFIINRQLLPKLLK